ncbi:MAG: M16 family metallopeptidase [Nostocoides sp.]
MPDVGSSDAAVPARPPVAPVKPWSFPRPQEYRLDNGIRLLAHDLPGQYVISMRMAMPHRMSAEPRQLEGLSVLMAALMGEGTASHDPQGLAEVVERHGIALALGASDGTLGLDLDVPKRFLPTAVDLAREILAEPSFPEAEVRRAIATRLADIEQERASAPHRALRELAATFYEETQRASRPAGGSAETVRAITRDALLAHHRASVGPDRATVVIAGDLAGLDLPGLVGGSLGGWVNPDHVRAEPPSSPITHPRRVRVVVVDRPGSVQSELVIAGPGPDRHVGQDSGWAPYPVAAYVLGGSPNARIDAVLREEKGYTYGIRAGYRPRRAGGMFLVSGSVRSEVTAESLDILLHLLAEASEGFTEEEVRGGVDFISRTAPGRFATADQVADESLMVAVDGLPSTFTTDNLRRVTSLDALAVGDAYRRFAGEGWTVVIVGDAGAWAEQLAAAGHVVDVVGN